MKMHSFFKIRVVGRFFVMLVSLLGASHFASANHANNHHGEHGHHNHESMAASEPMSDESVYNLDSKWMRHDGKKVELKSLMGKPRLIVMAFTQCRTACPMLVNDMKSIAKKLTPAEQKKVELNMFSIDSARDTPENLRAFMGKMNLDGSKWNLFTSNSSEVNELAAVLGVQFKKLDSGDFVHSNLIIFLNEKGDIVARKDGLNTPSNEFVKNIKKALNGKS